MKWDHIKPYSYWIVCGMVVLITLGFCLLTTAGGTTGKSAIVVKKDADTQLAALVSIEARAKSDVTKARFNAEIDADLIRLSNDFLIRASWSDKLSEFVKGFDLQVDGLINGLVARSTVLSRQASEAKPNKEWHDEYHKVSGDLIRQLAKAGNVVLPPQTDPDFHETLRRTVGLPTVVRDMLGETDQRRVDHSRAFRQSEAIARRIMAVKGMISENPIAATALPEVPQTGQTVTWIDLTRNDVHGSVLSGTLQGKGKILPQTLRLSGPLAALLDAVAKLERNNDPTQPIIVVHKVDISRPPAAPPGSLREMASESLIATIQLSLLEFTPPLVQPPQETPQ